VLGAPRLASIITPREILHLDAPAAASGASGAAGGGAGGGAGDAGGGGAGDAGGELWGARAVADRVIAALLNYVDSGLLVEEARAMRPVPPKAHMDDLLGALAQRQLALEDSLGLVARDAASGAPTGYTHAAHNVLLLLSLPKGKRALCRAAPSLSPPAQEALLHVAFANVPFFVASRSEGAEADAADAQVVALLEAMIRTVRPRPPAPRDALPSGLAFCAALLATLADAHAADPAVLGALLRHPGGRKVITTLLWRGEAEVARVAPDAPPSLSAGPIYVDCPMPSRPEVEYWARLTERLAQMCT
jgi:hypothetical protein